MKNYALRKKKGGFILENKYLRFQTLNRPSVALPTLDPHLGLLDAQFPDRICYQQVSWETRPCKE